MYFFRLYFFALCIQPLSKSFTQYILTKAPLNFVEKTCKSRACLVQFQDCTLMAGFPHTGLAGRTSSQFLWDILGSGRVGQKWVSEDGFLVSLTSSCVPMEHRQAS